MISFWECPKPRPLFAPGGEPQLESVIFSVYHEDERTMFGAHLHEDKLEIILAADGKGTRLCGWKCLAFQKGDLLIHEPGSLHDENAAHDSTASYCVLIPHMQLAGMPVNRLLQSGESPVIHTGSRFGQLETLVKTMHTLLRERPAGCAEASTALCSAYVALIAGLLEEQRSGILPDPVLEPDTFLCDRARAYIDKNYAEPLTLQSISSEVRISPSYLSHIFKCGTGFSPMQYILHRRLGEAQELLVTTDWPVTEIALKTGFETPNNFYKVFVKQVGMSPSRFRKHYREQ